MNKLSRSVSIIGVGTTPYGKGDAHPEVQELTEQELISWAAMRAYKDAGISPGKMEILFQGQLCNISYTHSMGVACDHQDWVGMHGKPSLHHEEGCCTGYHSFYLAVMAVASGACDYALATGVEILSTMTNPYKPACFRDVPSLKYSIENIPTILGDPSYSRFPSNTPHSALFSYPADDYMREYGISPEELDDAMNGLLISCRRGSSRHPMARYQREIADLAREAGLSSPWDYVRDERFNPRVSLLNRKLHSQSNCDGASAVIVCPTELAYQYKQKPIEVLGVAGASMDTRHPRNEVLNTQKVIHDIYENTGVRPEEIDLLLCQDLRIFDQIYVAEAAGYIPKGEGWKYAIDGRTAFDGDRPINVHGGRTCFGHAYGASGLADVGEMVVQMRGQAGERALKKKPHTGLIRGIGGGQNAFATILRAME